MSKIKMNKTCIKYLINYVSSSDFSQSKKATINKCLDKQLQRISAKSPLL